MQGKTLQCGVEITTCANLKMPIWHMKEINFHGDGSILMPEMKNRYLFLHQYPKI